MINKLWYNQITGVLQSNPPWAPMKDPQGLLRKQFEEMGWKKVDEDFRPPVSAEVLKAQKISEINNIYDPQIDELGRQANRALLSGDDALLAQLRTQYASLIAERDTKISEAEGGNI